MNSSIVIVQRIFPEYRRAVFNELSNKYKLHLIHSKNRSGIKQAHTKYASSVSVIQYGKDETHVFIPCLNLLYKFKSNVIIYEFSIGILSLPFHMLWAKLTNRKFILWGHGYNRKIGFDPERLQMDRYRLWL